MKIFTVHLESLSQCPQVLLFLNMIVNAQNKLDMAQGKIFTVENLKIDCLVCFDVFF